MRRALLLAAALAGAGCPTLPPAPSRPQARVITVERRPESGPPAELRVRLAVDGRGDALDPVAVDWELAAEAGPLLRGRSDHLEFVVILPAAIRAELTPRAELRLRGAIHLRGPDGQAIAPFDEAVAPR